MQEQERKTSLSQYTKGEDGLVAAVVKSQWDEALQSMKKYSDKHRRKNNAILIARNFFYNGHYKAWLDLVGVEHDYIIEKFNIEMKKVEDKQ